jgi:hypothetical protein
MSNPTPQQLPASLIRCMSAQDRAALGLEGAGTGNDEAKQPKGSVEAPRAISADQAQDRFNEQSERELQRLCENELSRRGIVYLHLRTKQQAAAAPGWPDLTFCARSIGGDPVPIAVELKAKHGKLRIDQEATLACMYLNGWQTAVVRSFDEFRELLNDPPNWKGTR